MKYRTVEQKIGGRFNTLTTTAKFHTTTHNYQADNKAKGKPEKDWRSVGQHTNRSFKGKAKTSRTWIQGTELCYILAFCSGSLGNQINDRANLCNDHVVGTD